MAATAPDAGKLTYPWYPTWLLIVHSGLHPSCGQAHLQTGIVPRTLAYLERIMWVDQSIAIELLLDGRTRINDRIVIFCVSKDAGRQFVLLKILLE